MANQESFSWKTKNGGKIYGQKWLAKQHTHAIIIFVHGLGEHIGRYNHIADFFNKKNITLFGFDHRGHGKSSGKRGHIPSTKDYFLDIDQILEISKNEFPNIPIFLYGHSLGGNMVLNYSLRKKPQIKGVICTSPGLAVGVPIPPLKLFLARILKSLIPSLTTKYNLDVENLSHDPEVVKNYIEDPLVHPMVSAKLAMDMFANGEWIIDNANNFSIPLLLMAGTDDHIVNIEKIKEFGSKVPSDFLDLELYSGLYHEIHNEYEKEEIFARIFDWITRQLES